MRGDIHTNHHHRREDESCYLCVALHCSNLATEIIVLSDESSCEVCAECATKAEASERAKRYPLTNDGRWFRENHESTPVSNSEKTWHLHYNLEQQLFDEYVGHGFVQDWQKFNDDIALLASMLRINPIALQRDLRTKAERNAKTALMEAGVIPAEDDDGAR